MLIELYCVVLYIALHCIVLCCNCIVLYCISNKTLTQYVIAYNSEIDVCSHFIYLFIDLLIWQNLVSDITTQNI